MNKILYLHIGYPKTGSTTIQKYLSSTTEELKVKKVDQTAASLWCGNTTFDNNS
jgi:hypothetical protein